MPSPLHSDGGNHFQSNSQVPRSASASYHIEALDDELPTTPVTAYTNTFSVQNNFSQSGKKNCFTYSLGGGRTSRY